MRSSSASRRRELFRPHDVVVPGVLVQLIVAAPDQKQTTNNAHERAYFGEIFRLFVVRRAEIDVPKVIARRVAQESRDGDAVDIGFGISANVPRILIEVGRHGAVTWVIEQGAVGGVPLLDFQFGCASNAEAIVPSPQQFTYFQGGGFDMSLLSFLQIDRYGSVNVSRLGARPHVTAGAGGFVDITARARKSCSPVFSRRAPCSKSKRARYGSSREGKIKKLVEEVEQVSFSGPRAVQQGQEIVYVTERCAMRLERQGVTVVEIAPGVDLQRDVLDQASFPLRVARSLAKMDEKLFHPDLIGLIPRPAEEREDERQRRTRVRGRASRLTLRRAEKLICSTHAPDDSGVARTRRPSTGTARCGLPILAARARRSPPAATSPRGAAPPALEMLRGWTRAC